MFSVGSEAQILPFASLGAQDVGSCLFVPTLGDAIPLVVAISMAVTTFAFVATYLEFTEGMHPTNFVLAADVDPASDFDVVVKDFVPTIDFAIVGDFIPATKFMDATISFLAMS